VLRDFDRPLSKPIQPRQKAAARTAAAWLGRIMPISNLLRPLSETNSPNCGRNTVIRLRKQCNDSGRERLQKFDAAAVGPELTDEQFREAIAALGRPKQQDAPRQYEESNAAEH